MADPKDGKGPLDELSSVFDDLVEEAEENLRESWRELREAGSRGSRDAKRSPGDPAERGDEAEPEPVDRDGPSARAAGTRPAEPLDGARASRDPRDELVEDARRAGQYYGQVAGDGMHAAKGVGDSDAGRQHVKKIQAIRKKYHARGRQAAADGRVNERYPRVDSGGDDQIQRGEALTWEAFRTGYYGKELADDGLEAQQAADKLAEIVRSRKRRRGR